ncbi:YdhK family protein [Mesobacillus sp. AQ2]|jgi:hypothetical protein|uniref:YdhK family protein n=1 Tax=unclassified Mesobacillus TaxID=2675270 RepID=UPI00203D56FA|nr:MULTISPECIES: YdhK family protein [unclassified Mesobacillus]MCM3124363.1 YdhK family protein [Mesobacillus sp. MER 33]MCM3234927.1 YdhK family protein [Mesobacillus sp. MER 48]WHX41232.1 YdhK family protein [Mesobacillus sp. AQ2]
MKSNKFLSIIITLIMALVLSACNGNNNTSAPPENNADKKTEESNEHMEMDHSSSGEVPEELEVAENPTYPVGSQAVMHAKHMKGMDGAVATIAGAYNTTVYSVSYTPTNGGERVEDHKWVIHEEIENAGKEPFKPGDEVKLNADHMKGMNGATAVIDSAEETTVYMVDFKNTETGKEVKNHKWVIESELSPQK